MFSNELHLNHEADDYRIRVQNWSGKLSQGGFFVHRYTAIISVL